MSSKNKKIPAFSIGPKAGRDVKNALSKSKNPAETIASYQQTRSLHSMFAKAFGTTTQYEMDDNNRSEDNGTATVESLDTDSVVKFLGHMGVSQYYVHKRIGDALQKQLENELRKVTSEGALLHLLQNCWPYATSNAEFRPILWAVLKQLGAKTPPAVLQALAEREKESRKLKHLEIFRPLPPLLKRLVWEADWTEKVPIEKENSSTLSCKKYLQMVQSTMLYETIQPLIDKYTSTPLLVESSGKYFVNSVMERRVLTSARRALTNSASVTANSPTRAGTLLNKSSAASSNNVAESLMQAGKAVSQIRNTLSDMSRGAASYRPNLLHAVLSILMAQHGTQATNATKGTSCGLLSGSSHLHCTLVTDILLSTGGPLPKQFVHVHGLARLLDDAVKNGIFTDKDLMKVQQTLKQIFDEEPTEETGQNDQGDGSKKKKVQDDESSKKKSAPPNKSLIRQLNQIITAGLTEMKDSDPQTLFLNPVTDAIAPGYSKLIKKPMSIVTMENKIENNQYHDIKAWEGDVRLMFRNCVDYNRGPTGQWFRGEAKRQLKVFTDEILPKSKSLFKVEQQKRNPDEDLAALKRKREEEAEKNKLKIKALEPGRKKRKVDPQEQSLSMLALASMMLADPFVVRILLDRVLRSLRVDTAKGVGIPAEHRVIPSTIQLLYLAQWSPQICAIRGRQFIIFDNGLQLPKTTDAIESTLPYVSLRQYLPVIIHLLRDADLDKRLAVGGDLHTVSKSALPRPEPPRITIHGDSPSLPQIAMALLEGAYINVCLPGNSQDVSLSISFAKFSKTFLDLADGNVSNEVSFFKSLVPVILRHKARLNKTVRDVIVSTWLEWLKTTTEEKMKYTSKLPQGSIDSAAHEYLIFLLNEWASSFGNILMPRDLLLKVSNEVVKVVNATEVAPERKFSALWKANETTGFGPVKVQYERLLSLLPETHATQWKESAGIVTTDQSNSETKAETTAMETDES
mmetsp:Transcript_2863/g.6756  ORF Transcript_2863/g.6756 Transcript_2863/m.6756 type:complete len:971 (-) Transcript_2863:111-3023(-)|eukprot:CAMPEP_0116081112 /NCGR_PEP_ID=MMETSP0327-20121206/2030_1 /TAXON_ID=44447 /ORGANISM="Pseudo-nitzschia delicatissima, Strain B596" /LENGTH=970 /DNA_ID=CAMNT_0003571839 /DNA_START=58 /DNA_END=2970 /DNA_ORIENTATION=-